MKEHLLYEDNILKIIFNESKSKAESNKNFYIDKIFNILNKYYKKQIKKDKNLNENRVFTKSNKTWEYLKNNMKR